MGKFQASDRRRKRSCSKAGALWKGTFHLSELTSQTIPVVMRSVPLLNKTIQPDKSNPKYYAKKEMVSQRKSHGKPLFCC